MDFILQNGFSIKKFIAAERMGDCEEHLNCIEVMIPFVHASGHMNYANSAGLYLQRHEET